VTQIPGERSQGDPNGRNSWKKSGTVGDVCRTHDTGIRRFAGDCYWVRTAILLDVWVG
jgi:hypothetical protein